MEPKINIKIEKYLSKFKEDICTNIQSEKFTNNKELIKYIYDYKRLMLSSIDFCKRKRVSNTINPLERCLARRANGEQCTRRKKSSLLLYCGTHSKGIPHGSVEMPEYSETNINLNSEKTVEIWHQDIQGITYFIDDNNNVYKPEDILNDKKNPCVVAKWGKNDEESFIITESFMN